MINPNNYFLGPRSTEVFEKPPSGTAGRTKIPIEKNCIFLSGADVP